MVKKKKGKILRNNLPIISFSVCVSEKKMCFHANMFMDMFT